MERFMGFSIIYNLINFKEIYFQKKLPDSRIFNTWPFYSLKTLSVKCRRRIHEKAMRICKQINLFISGKQHGIS